MKMKNKGKVYPSPASSCSLELDALAVLKILPAAIVALASVLSLEDREVLAYLITRSLKTTTTIAAANNNTSGLQKKPLKKPTGNASAAAAAKTHKPPMFDCECFDCYTSYWFRWDSSPNRELINQAIEAFEDQLATGEKSPKKTTRGKRRDKTGRRVVPEGKPADLPVPSSPEPLAPEFPDDEASPSPADSPARSNDDAGKRVEADEVLDVVGAAETATEPEEDIVLAAISHKGLARKVLPDVLGLFNSRLWSLWSPNA